MNKLFKIIIFIAISCSSLYPIASYAFWINTHEKISDKTIENNKATLNSAIKSQSGLENALDLFLFSDSKNKTLKNWIIYGSNKEDDTPRYLNHFYSPLNGSGLNDYFSGQPSFEWAADWGNEWSWRVARNRYHLGLTSTTDTERRTALADSFRALGQNMHLVQDLAAPAHVRNDAHPRGDGFEAYTSENVNSLNFVPIAFSGPKNSVSASAPKQLWNSDQYDGTNPSNSTAIGLAEYTNANFASEDTIFTENNLNDWIPLNENHYFPFPRQEDTIVFAESQNRTLNGFAVYRKYFDKVGGGQTIRHFATASRLYPYLLDDPEPSIQGFDDQCYKDYADLLIPRAVGYSAALLDYFFRGQIDMTADSGQYVIKNESDENMSGAFRLYYDDKYDMRKLVPAAEWNLSISAKGASSPVTFTAPTDAKEPGKYMLVFLGTHGAESGAVVGRFVELSKPWSFLLVKQLYATGTVSDRFGENNEDMYNQIKWSSKGFGQIMNTYSFSGKWELKWLGKPEEILSVSVVKIDNWNGCTVVPLYSNKDENDAKVKIINQSSTGFLYVDLINIDTNGEFILQIKAKNGEVNKTYNEPIFISFGIISSNRYFDNGMSWWNYIGRTLYSGMQSIILKGYCASLFNSHYRINVVNDENLYIDKENPTRYGFGYVKDSNSTSFLINAADSFIDLSSHKPLDLQPFFPVEKKHGKIHRIWSATTLSFLESVGVNLSTLDSWDLEYEYWDTPYRP